MHPQPRRGSRPQGRAGLARPLRDRFRPPMPTPASCRKPSAPQPDIPSALVFPAQLSCSPGQTRGSAVMQADPFGVGLSRDRFRIASRIDRGCSGRRYDQAMYAGGSHSAHGDVVGGSLLPLTPLMRRESTGYTFGISMRRLPARTGARPGSSGRGRTGRPTGPRVVPGSPGPGTPWRRCPGRA